MRRLQMLIIAFSLHALAFSAVGTESVSYLTDFEANVLREHNLVRTDPEAYADHLREWLRYYQGKRRELPGRRPVVTTEGVKGVEEAIEFLVAAEPLPALRPSRGLAEAARDHVADSGGKGWMGHAGSDGSEPGERANRYGKWFGRVGENIVYGGYNAREFVIRLLIDDGVPERGHRMNIFSPDYTMAGVAFGYHDEYETMCVINYASEFEEASDHAR